AIAEATLAAEEAGEDEIDDAEELAEVVLERRAGERDREVARQRSDGVGALRGDVLHVLRLVDHDRRPVRPGEGLRLALERLVRDDRDVRDARDEASELRAPVR